MGPFYGQPQFGIQQGTTTPQVAIWDGTQAVPIGQLDEVNHVWTSLALGQTGSIFQPSGMTFYPPSTIYGTDVSAFNDSQPGLQAVFNYCVANGLTLVLPPGVYFMSNLVNVTLPTLPSAQARLTVIAYGCTFVRSASNGLNGGFQIGAANGIVTWLGGTIDISRTTHTTTGANALGIASSGAQSTAIIRDVFVFGGPANSFASTSGGDTGFGIGTTNQHIVNCTAQGFADAGFYITGTAEYANPSTQVFMDACLALGCTVGYVFKRNIPRVILGSMRAELCPIAMATAGANDDTHPDTLIATDFSLEHLTAYNCDAGLQLRLANNANIGAIVLQDPGLAGVSGYTSSGAAALNIQGTTGATIRSVTLAGRNAAAPNGLALTGVVTADTTANGGVTYHATNNVVKNIFLSNPGGFSDVVTSVIENANAANNLFETLPSVGVTTPSSLQATSYKMGFATSTWTPAITFGGGNTGITYTTQTGQYTVIGNLLIATFNIALSSKGSSTGAAAIGGLPFTFDSRFNQGITIGNAANFTGLTGALVGNASASLISLAQFSATGIAAISDSSFTNTTTIRGTFIGFISMAYL